MYTIFTIQNSNDAPHLRDKSLCLRHVRTGREAIQVAAEALQRGLGRTLMAVAPQLLAERQHELWAVERRGSGRELRVQRK